MCLFTSDYPYINVVVGGGGGGCDGVGGKHENILTFIFAYEYYILMSHRYA